MLPGDGQLQFYNQGELEHLLTKMQKMGSTNTQIILNTQLDRNLTLEE